MKTKPAVEAIEVTLSDSTGYNPAFRALYIGGSGDLKIKDASGNVATFVAVVAGTTLPVETAMLYSTGTTATNIVGLR